jgi:hypothetical protein
VHDLQGPAVHWFQELRQAWQGSGAPLVDSQIYHVCCLSSPTSCKSCLPVTLWRTLCMARYCPLKDFSDQLTPSFLQKDATCASSL